MTDRLFPEMRVIMRHRIIRLDLKGNLYGCIDCRWTGTDPDSIADECCPYDFKYYG